MAPRSKKKPLWIVEKERQKSAGSAETVWLFGLHAVRDALENPLRERIRLMVTKNASDKLSSSIITSGIDAEIIDPRKFNPPIDEFERASSRAKKNIINFKNYNLKKFIDDSKSK